MQDNNGKKSSMGPLARGAGHGATKAGKGLAKGTYHAARKASSHITKLAAYFSVNVGWFIGAGVIVFIIILMLVLGVTISSDNPTCGSGSSSDTEDVSGGTGGTGGLPEAQKNSKEWKMFRATYAAAKGQGADDPHAAAIAGNADHESQHFELGWKVSQQNVAASGDTGIGIFQFNRSYHITDFSPEGQVKAILSEGGHPSTPSCDGARGGLSRSSFLHESGSIDKLTDDFECSFEAGGDSDMSYRDKLANLAYKMFKGVGGSSSDDASSSEDSSNGGGSCGGSDDTDDSGLQGILQYAKKWLGGLPYSNTGRDVGAWAVAKGDFSKKKTAGADCSSFQWGVYRHQGYKTTPQPWTGNIYPPCKVISGSDAKPGDTVILGNKDSGDDGHVMILESTWHGKTNSTKVINEGGDGSDVNESGFKDAALSIMNRDALHFVAPVK